MENKQSENELRLGNPAPLAETPGPDSPLGRLIKATVMAQVAGPAKRSLPLSRRWTALIVLLVASLSVAGVWAVSSRPVTSVLGALCYETPSLEGSAVMADSSLFPSTGDCAVLWAEGMLPIARPLDTEEKTSVVNAVPPLVACVNATGVLVVFPSDNPNLCLGLGLAAPGPTSPEVNPAHSLREALVEQLFSQPCRSLEEGRQIVEGQFTRLGLQDWTLEVRGEVSGRPCVSLAVEETQRTIILVPIPDMG